MPACGKNENKHSVASLLERCVIHFNTEKDRSAAMKQHDGLGIENKKTHHENLHTHFHGNRTSGWQEHEVYKATQAPHQDYVTAE